MNLKILNSEFRHPSDNWYQIEALGNHPNRAAGVVQVIDHSAVEAIVKNFNAAAAAGQLRQGNEMLIDHEHFSYQPDQETRAYGWLQELQNREDGIYGRIRWTLTGKAAVDGGDYRFFSTEYDNADLQPVSQSAIGNRQSAMKQVRPLRLAGLTLTNMNNNRRQKPITNRDSIKNFAGSREPAAHTKTNNQGKKMQNIATKLGLAAEASEDAILAEVTKLLNRATTAEAELAPLKNRATTLETEIQTLLGEQVDGILADHKITDGKMINRLKPLLTPLKNRADRVACMAELGFKPAQPATRVLNRGSGAASAQPAGETDPAAENARAQNIMNRAGAILKETPSIGLATATAMAQRELK